VFRVSTSYKSPRTMLLQQAPLCNKFLLVYKCYRRAIQINSNNIKKFFLGFQINFHEHHIPPINPAHSNSVLPEVRNTLR